MSPDQVRFTHMLDAAYQVSSFIEGRSRSDLDSEQMLGLAVTRLLEIIGEAAGHLSPELQAKYPDIPWREMSGLRNRLIHGYFDVDMDTVWSIVSEDIPTAIKSRNLQGVCCWVRRPPVGSS